MIKKKEVLSSQKPRNTNKRRKVDFSVFIKNLEFCLGLFAGKFIWKDKKTYNCYFCYQKIVDQGLKYFSIHFHPVIFILLKIVNYFFFSFVVSLRPLKQWFDSLKNQIECSRESVYRLFHMIFFFYSFFVFGQISRHLIEKLR